MKKLSIQVLGLVAAIAAVGCSNGLENPVPAMQSVTTKDPVIKEADAFRPSSPAGVTLPNPAPDPKKWAELVNTRGFTSRPDPFALHPKERAFEVAQTTERIFGQIGFRTDVDMTEPMVVVPVIEPQPYRRLAGVIVGESVLALIDMGDGQLQLIRPGQVISGWRVESIDGDKAILTRSGNVLPHQVVVRLESPPFGGGNPGGGGGGAGGGGNPGTGGGGGKILPGLGNGG